MIEGFEEVKFEMIEGCEEVMKEQVRDDRRL